MQVFVLSNDFQENAESYFDTHVNKIATEIAQIICTTARAKIEYQFDCVDPSIYRMAHINHPWVKWCMESWYNFNWLASLHEALTDEYGYRYRKIHATIRVVDKIYEIFEDKIIPNIDINDRFDEPNIYPLCMPDRFKSIDAVAAYRAYYIGEKMHLCKYTNRSIPGWMQDAYDRKKS